MKRDSAFYLDILAHLLLELRHLSEDELECAPKLAYIFHNVPFLLQRDFNEAAGEEDWETIRARAEHVGLLPVVEGWANDVFDRVAQRSNHMP